MIDWNLPLETDEPTPRGARFNSRISGMCYVDIGSRTFAYIALGEAAHRGNMMGPAIRNVAQPTLRTSDECLQRMEALVRRISDDETAFYSLEARKIVEMLPAPAVDPDLIEARKIAVLQHADSNIIRLILNGGRDETPVVRAALAALKRGRQLGPEGYKWHSSTGDTTGVNRIIYERVFS